MGLYTNLPEEITEVDIIIAGGGTVGSVVASRLATAGPNLSILVIEGGPNNQIPTIAFPAFFLAHLAPDSKTNDFYRTKETPETANRSLLLPTGSVLGGGSSTNMMMYSRAQRSDWDSWRMPGWSAVEMLPFLRKLETYHGDDPKGVHGHDGPIHVSGGTYSSPKMSEEFIAAAAKLGFPKVTDTQDLDSVNVVGRAQRFISPEGKRQDAASCYLHPLLQGEKHPNLHVLVQSQVARILFDEGKRAVGVEFRPNPRFHPEDAGAPIRTVKAKKLVVLSAGACGTPAILERSGVGDPKVLQKVGLPVVHDLPGVGNGYEDHHLVAYPYLNNMGLDDTLDGLILGRKGSWEDLMKSENKMLGWNGQEVQVKIRPTDAEVAALGPEFQRAWDEEFKDYPDKPLVVMTLLAGFPGDLSLATGDPCLAVTAFTVYPFSRGHIHITGQSLDDPVDFETGFFTDDGQLDVKKHIWAYKKQREIIRRMPMYRGEMAVCHPQFAADSKAANVLLEEPLPADVQDIEYTAEDDALLENWLRKSVSTTWHSLGTCKMLPQEEKGVVDARLGVHGIQGLKIADLSIAPKNVGANTNNTVLAIGEKAADLFLQELGLSKA